ncbi:MAG: hypothetical protein EHM55_14100 [Acidobacteria bacterium]|nr:MAG: hypothetical protein EHM55_14100 [Acidobacteriota bacterium]
MRTSNVTSVPIRALAAAWAELAEQQNSAGEPADANGLKVFLDCDDESLENRIRSEMDFAVFVEDRQDADAIVRATPVLADGKIRYHLVRFIGAGRFELIEATTRLHLPLGSSMQRRAS